VWVAAIAAVTGVLIAVSTQGLGSGRPTAVAAAPAGLRPVADTYVVPSNPDANFGSRSSMFATTSANRAFLRFDTDAAVPAGRTVTAATLHVYVLHVATTTPGLEVHPAPSTWSESGLTGRNRPAAQADVVSDGAPELTEHSWVAIPLDPDAVSASGSTSFELLHRTPNSELQLASRESPWAPRLELTLSGAPTPSSTTATATPSGTPSGTPSATPTGTRTSSASGAVLPIDVPVSATSGRSKRLAFAHYFPPYPVSFDNRPPEDDYYARSYLQPSGEKGKHKAFGGLLRDRPMGRAPRPGDWRAADFEAEVRQAMAAGLDGFAVDMLSMYSVNWQRMVALLEAAHRVSPDFKIIVMPDTTSTGKGLPDVLAEATSRLAKYPALMRLPDGRVVIAPFKAEGRSVEWWTKWLDIMRTRHGIRVALVPTFLSWGSNAEKFAPISYGFSTWGNSNPAYNGGTTDDAQKAHELGKIYAAPVRVQDVRPRSGVYEEPENTTTLRQTWRAAVDGGADWVMLNTWNDYSEATSIAPSAEHGWSFLDISSYYLTWWRTGKAPTVVRDGIYLTHRTQPHAAEPTFPQTKLMKLRSGSTAPRDRVEALVFLKAPATVTLQVGSHRHRWKAPAGMSIHTAALATGTVSGRVERDGRVTTSVTSPYRVTATPYVQDLQYHAVSSLRP